MDVRELLKELRRLLREKSLRTDFCCEGFCLALAGESGVRKLSVRSMSLFEEVDVDIFASGSFSGCSFSGSGVGGSVALRMSSAEVGCDERGPPPAVGGRASGMCAGDLGGVSGGAGMFVPSVRENSTGVRVRKEDLRRDWSAGMSRLARWPVRYRGGFEMRRVQARQGGVCCRMGDTSRGLCLLVLQQYTRWRDKAGLDITAVTATPVVLGRRRSR